MSSIIIKRVKGRSYRYLQTSRRVGNKIRTTAIYLGPVDASTRKKKKEDEWRFNMEMARAAREDVQRKEYQRKTFGETAEEREQREQQEKLETLYAEYGLTM